MWEQAMWVAIPFILDAALHLPAYVGAPARVKQEEGHNTEFFVFLWFSLFTFPLRGLPLVFFARGSQQLLSLVDR